MSVSTQWPIRWARTWIGISSIKKTPLFATKAKESTEMEMETHISTEMETHISTEMAIEIGKETEMTRLASRAGDQTLVVVCSLRGREQADQMLCGLGGITPGRLLGYNLDPSGHTWLWERIALLLEQLSAVEPLPAARILLLDLSGSMATQAPILKRMWASIPTAGMVAQGTEIMVLTDGQDNQSAQPYRGLPGWLALLDRAESLGWDCGRVAMPNARGKLFITLVDVGDGKMSSQLAGLVRDEHTTLVCTRDVDMIARIVRNQRPPLHGVIGADAGQLAAAYPPLNLEAIQTIEQYLGMDGVNLAEMLEHALGQLGEPVRSQTRTATLKSLTAILNGQPQIIDRRGAHRAGHSCINALFYKLAQQGILVHNDGSPRVWSAGCMVTHLQDQLAALCQSGQFTVISEQFTQFLQSIAPEPHVQAYLLETALAQLGNPHEPATKRQKV